MKEKVLASVYNREWWIGISKTMMNQFGREQVPVQERQGLTDVEVREMLADEQTEKENLRWLRRNGKICCCFEVFNALCFLQIASVERYTVRKNKIIVITKLRTSEI